MTDNIHKFEQPSSQPPPPTDAAGGGNGPGGQNLAGHVASLEPHLKYLVTKEDIQKLKAQFLNRRLGDGRLPSVARWSRLKWLSGHLAAVPREALDPTAAGTGRPDAQGAAHPLGDGPVATSVDACCARGRACAPCHCGQQFSLRSPLRAKASPVSTTPASRREAVASAKCRARRNSASPSAHRCSEIDLLAMPANRKLSQTVATVVFAGHDDRRWRVGQTAAIQPEGISEMRPGVSLALGPEDKAAPTEPGGTERAPCLSASCQWQAGSAETDDGSYCHLASLRRQ